MPTILANNNLKLHIDHPLEGYTFSRFDWTGKITKALFKGLPITTIERQDTTEFNLFGKGLYNEFGLETAIGFNETKTGDWFHKIGVGLLKKEGEDYLFSKAYEIKPASFEVISEEGKITIHCISDSINGYAYAYAKTISLIDNGFMVDYNLKNVGEKVIVTSEYNHNFIGVANDKMGKDYILKLPFKLDRSQFTASVNPEKIIEISQNEIQHNMITSKKAIIGMTPRRVAYAGKFLQTGTIIKPQLVKRGNSVGITFQEGPLTLSAKGKALQSGAIGDTVRVTNSNSSRTVDAIVSGENQVVVN